MYWDRQNHNFLIESTHGSITRQIDVEYVGDRRIVTWIPRDNKTNEISRGSKHHVFLDYLGTVHKIIKSFEFICLSETLANRSIERMKTKEDPLIFLKLRFAEIEISEHENERIYSILRRSSSNNGIEN